MSTRFLLLPVCPLFLLASAGCLASRGVAPSPVPAASVATASRRAESAPSPAPPPPMVVRAVCAEPVLAAEPPSNVELEDVPSSPIPTLPRDVQTCPIDPVVQLMAGRHDPDTQQNALMTIALMFATGTAYALRSADDHPHARHVGSGIDDLILQTDDDQSAVSKQRRPPYLFTLGWKF